MPVKLTKGGNISLKKEAPNLKRIMVGLGWDPIKKMFGSSFDADASVICIDSNGRHESTVYYGRLSHSSGAIKHHGDNLTGDGDGDDERISIELDRVPANIDRLAIIINIYSAHSRHQDFSQVKNCFVRVVDEDTNKELVRYDVEGQYKGATGMFVADIYRHNGEWKIKALGEGVDASDISQMAAMKCSR